ncbi:hypothetical protein GOODEAATRI_020093, partial [Goodea atripinnis]
AKEKDAYCGDQFCHISTPRVFADMKYKTLEDLTNDLASCGIGGPAESVSPFSVLEKEREDINCSFDQFSESDNYEPMFMRPSKSTNRSSFIKDFIYCQKRRSWIRNNSIATVEHKECLLLKKRRQTFPGTSLDPELIHEDILLPYNESFSSFVMCSLPFQTERLGRNKQFDDRFPTFGRKEYVSSQSRESCKTSSDSSETNGELTGTELDKEMSSEFHVEEIIQGGLAIQVIPPSCSGSEEQILQTDSTVFVKDKDEKGFTQNDSDSALLEHSNCPTMTVPVDALQHNFLQIDSTGSCRRDCLQKSIASDNLFMSPSKETDNSLNKHNVAMEIEPNSTEQSVNDSSFLLMTVRERTVQINKGAGEYPWGFRIQFSKPIVVTEVDTSPDILTLTIGSDIARGPNTPRPPCRGYLHKRTQSGLIKGWRKRWFVLTHDCCLYYYKNKRVSIGREHDL